MAMLCSWRQAEQISSKDKSETSVINVSILLKIHYTDIKYHITSSLSHQSSHIPICKSNMRKINTGINTCSSDHSS